MSDCLRSLSGRELKVTYDRDAGVIDLFDGDNRFLSNFWPVSVRYGGASYPSVEHAYQAAKCANPAERKQFRNITAGQAKRLGRHVQIRHDWEKVKIPIMFALLEQKFLQNEELRQNVFSASNYSNKISIINKLNILCLHT